jgi:hypothetical protein
MLLSTVAQMSKSKELFELSKKRSRAGRLGGAARAAAMTKKERRASALKASRAAAKKRTAATKSRSVKGRS